MGRTTVYLAGKISKHDWRGSLPYIDRWGTHRSGDSRWGDGSGEEYNDAQGDLPERWTPREAGKNLLITGPFFESCDHGCGHGPATHGVNAGSDRIRSGRCVGLDYPNPRRRVWDLCTWALMAADVFFFWMDDESVYGSLVELGMARAANKRTIIAHPGDEGFCENDGHGECAERDGNGSTECEHRGPWRRDELWFAKHSAHEVWICPTAPEALAWLDGYLAPPAPEPQFGSEIERKFWQAFQGRPMAAALVPQYEYRRGCGRTFRPDFAFPQWKVAVELDGFKYHATPEAFADDLCRQREMERDGWRFVRFTGKEINADVHACIAEAERFTRMIVGVG